MTSICLALAAFLALCVLLVVRARRRPPAPESAEAAGLREVDLYRLAKKLDSHLAQQDIHRNERLTRHQLEADLDGQGPVPPPPPS